VRLVELLSKGQGGAALDSLLEATDHTGFVVVGALPALVQTVLQAPFLCLATAAAATALRGWRRMATWASFSFQPR
jgi:hypothetical protein